MKVRDECELCVFRFSENCKSGMCDKGKDMTEDTDFPCMLRARYII